MAPPVWMWVAALGMQASPSEPPPDAALLPPEETDEQARTLPSVTGAEAGQVPAVDLAADYTFDVWHVAAGGHARGWRYLDNVDLTLRVSLDRAIGWDGATLFAYGLYNNGEGLSGELVGDLQGVSNIETPASAVRLYEAWFEQRFADDRASVKVGLYDLNSEFDTNDVGALFLNSSHGIGPDFSQSGRNGPSIFPVTSLAFRADYRLSDSWLVRAAILDGVPGDPDRPGRTPIRLGDGDGALLVGEAEYRAGPTKLVAGYWRYTARFEALDSFASTKAARGNDGVYLLAEQRLARFGNDEARGLAGWLRIGVADRRFNPIGAYAGAGLVFTGIAAGRPEDQFGLALGFAGLGGPYRRTLAADGGDAARSEVTLEATYRLVVTPWLSLQPDLQVVLNPGGRADLGDALLLGFRTQIGFR